MKICPELTATPAFRRRAAEAKHTILDNWASGGLSAFLETGKQNAMPAHESAQALSLQRAHSTQSVVGSNLALQSA